MVKRPSVTRRWLTAATWPVGVALTSWDYMWRSTPMHRSETRGSAPAADERLTVLPSRVSTEDVQGYEHGHGPLFHRRYSARIGDCELAAGELMGQVQSDLNRPAPIFARFQKVTGRRGTLAVGDEYVVRMPGPWDGPVRVIEVASQSFRLATLDGHLEAGQIEFRVSDSDVREVTFEIESWARSSTRLANLLYHRLRMSKEVQAHMWISFLEGVADLAGGRLRGGVTIDTERVEVGASAR
jgi:Domain of unknown function (DUF1990)